MRIHKKTKLYFFAYYFQNIMELVSEPTLYKDPKAKATDMLGMINEYKRRYWYYRDKSSVKLWIMIKEYYFDNFCEIHYYSMQINEGNL